MKCNVPFPLKRFSAFCYDFGRDFDNGEGSLTFFAKIEQGIKTNSKAVEINFFIIIKYLELYNNTKTESYITPQFVQVKFFV